MPSILIFAPPDGRFNVFVQVVVVQNPEIAFQSFAAASQVQLLARLVAAIAVV